MLRRIVVVLLDLGFLRLSVVLQVLFDFAEQLPEVGWFKQHVVQDIVSKGQQVLHRPEQGDSKRGDAALKSLEIAGLEDANEILTALHDDLVTLVGVGLVALQVVGRQLEMLDGPNDLLVDAGVGSLQVISDRDERALGEVDLLSVDRRVGVCLSYETARPTDYDLVEEVVQRPSRAACSRKQLPPGVPEQVVDRNLKLTRQVSGGDCRSQDMPRVA